MFDDKSGQKPTDDLTELAKVTKENAFKLRERLATFRRDKKYSYAKIVAELGWRIGVNPGEHFLAKFVSDFDTRWKGWEKYRSEFHQIIEWLMKIGAWHSHKFYMALEEREDFMFHALALWLQVGERTHEEMRDEAQGHYRVYRHSVYHDGMYVVGHCEISYNTKTFALAVTENYALPAETGTKRIKFRKLCETYTGYVCRKNQQYYIVTRDAAGDRYNHTSLPNLRRGQDKKLILMYGQTLGLFDGRAYTSRIMYERVENGKLNWDKSIGVFQEKDIPLTVRNYLNENPNRSKVDLPQQAV